MDLVLMTETVNIPFDPKGNCFMRLPLLLLMLLGAILPHPARAEFETVNDWVSAAPYDACPIAPLDWFTPAEAWAWEQICMDRGAYMQAVPEDDKRSRCHINPKDASPYGSILSSRFMLVVNTQEPFISHIPAKFAYFACGTVEDALQFTETRIPHTLSMEGFTFLGRVGFGSVDMSGNLYLSESKFFKDLDLDFASLDAFVARNATFRGKVNSEGAKISNNFILQGSDIQSSAIGDDKMDVPAEYSDPKPQETVELDPVVVIVEAVPDNPYLRQNELRYNKDNPWPDALDLHDASIGGNLQLSETRMIGKANLLRLKVGSGLYAKDAILGWVGLDQATVSHDVVLSGSVFGILTAQSLTAADVNLSGARAISASFLDARLHGGLYAEGLHADTLSAERIEVTKSVHLRGNWLDHEGASWSPTKIDDVNLAHSRIGNQVQLQGGIFGTIDLNGSRIGGSLVLFQNGNVPLWTDWSGLDLTNSSVRHLAARMPDSWVGAGLDTFLTGETCDYWESRFRDTLADPRDGRAADLHVCKPPEIHQERDHEASGPKAFVHFDLRGFRYDSIDERVGDPDSLRTIGRVADVNKLLDWVKASQLLGRADEREQNFSPSPYIQLANFLKKEGHFHKAKRVHIEMHLQRMWSYEFSVAGVFMFAADAVWGVLTLFGVYPGVAGLWFAVLVILGTLIAKSASCPGGTPTRAQFKSSRNEECESEVVEYDLAAASGEDSFAPATMTTPGYWSCFWYSLENALPLINPSDDHKTWQHGASSARSFFHFQKIAGFILATVLVGALTLN